tara:strand:- start:24867 stop:25283 length:417 start_codon:yes stop_codon:yes gene_type:complete
MQARDRKSVIEKLILTLRDKGSITHTVLNNEFDFEDSVIDYMCDIKLIAMCLDGQSYILSCNGLPFSCVQKYRSALSELEFPLQSGEVIIETSNMLLNDCYNKVISVTRKISFEEFKKEMIITLRETHPRLYEIINVE